MVLVYLNRLSDLLFVMARAANHRAGVPESDLVTADDARSGRRLRHLPGARPRRTTRTSRWPRGSCRPTCGRTSRPSTPLPAPPTTSPTKTATPTRERLRLLDEWLDAPARRVALGAGDADRRPIAVWRRRSRRPSSPRSATPCATRDLPVALLRGAALGVPPGRDRRRAMPSGPTVDDYCRRSANPVGRLVLRLFGYRDERLDRWSDAICTALQLTNFWQDFAVDWRRGRLYVPETEWRAAGARLDAADGAAGDDAAASGSTRWPPAARAPARSSTTAGRCSTTCAAGSAGSCGRPGTAAGASSSGSSRAASTRSRDAPEARRRRCPGGRVENAAVSRDTSFYYSFLVLPPAAARGHRHGVGCLPRHRRRGGRSGERRPTAADAAALLARRDRPRVRRRHAASRRRAWRCSRWPLRFALPRRAFEDLVDGVADGPRAHPLRHLRRAARVLLARGLDGRAHLPQHLRLPASRAAATTP